MSSKWVPSWRQQEHWLFPTLFAAGLVSVAVSLGVLTWSHWGSWVDETIRLAPLISIGLLLAAFWQRVGMLLSEVEWIRTILTDILKEPDEEYPSVASLLAARRALGLSGKDQ